VSVKNTFITFDDPDERQEELPARTRQSIASPRSRSAECSSPRREEECNDDQIVRLNKVLDGDQETLREIRSPVASPNLGTIPVLDGDQETLREIRSPVASPNLGTIPVPGFEGPGRVRADSYASSGMATPPGEAVGSPTTVEHVGPSPQELRQLKQRLEEVCHRGGYPTAQGRLQRASSSGSFWSVGSEVTDADGHPPEGMRHVRSNGSVSSITTFEANRSRACSFGSIGSMGRDGDGDGEPVEFDLHIVEDPEDGTCHESRSRQCHGDHRSSDQRQSHDKSGKVTRSRRPRSREAAKAPREPGRQSQERQLAGPIPVGLVDSAESSPTASPSPREKLPIMRKGSDASQCSGCSSPTGDKSAAGRAWQKEYRHSLVPKNVNLEATQPGDQEITTLMIRNIPNRYSQRDLIAELEDMGFGGKFNFLYIPLDKGTMANVGYAFVNFIDKEWAASCMEAFQEHRFKRHRKTSGKIASVSAAHLQGLEANLAHYERAVVNTAKLKQRRPVVIANISSSLAAALD